MTPRCLTIMFNITFLPEKLSSTGEPPGHQGTTTHVTVVAPRVDGSLHLPRGVAADPAVRRHGQRHAARGVGHVALDGVQGGEVAARSEVTSITLR